MVQQPPYILPKGTFDILPATQRGSSEEWHHVEQQLRGVATCYGFSEMRTPILEHDALFRQTAGSDLVSQQMYAFTDRGGRQLALRPEATAAVVRAFVAHKLDRQRGPHKFFYCGPMFRYERPQAGRFRQFHQFGVEAIGARSPQHDVELIDLLLQLQRVLGLQNSQLAINSIGDAAARQQFATALQRYLEPRRQQLSPPSQIRLHKNALRILDSKDRRDRALLTAAPQLADFLSPASRDYFQQLQLLLRQLDIPFTIDAGLVRGLDYYSETVFEVTHPALGAQNAIGGGGRYDHLIERMGGAPTPAAGFAIGIERLLAAMEQEQIAPPSPPGIFCYFIPLEANSLEHCFAWLLQLRHRQIAAAIATAPARLATALGAASAQGARYAVIHGATEAAQQRAQLKDLHTRQTFSISEQQLVARLAQLAVDHGQP